MFQKKQIHDLEFSFIQKSGEFRTGLFSAEEIEVEEQACLLSIIRDITEQKQAEADIRYLSFHDKMTKLYNRAYFEEELHRMDSNRNLPVSIIMGDVNGLKLINDTLGHREGDKLLIHIAEILKKACRQGDIVSRWGGDEFIILLPHCSADTALSIMKRIKDSSIESKDQSLETSLSMGMACKEKPEKKMREIIREAEERMYRDKLLQNKSNRSTFLNSLEKTLWVRNHETQEHCQRMQNLARKIAEYINLPEHEINNLQLLAALHDIGKIAIPHRILDKPGKLTPEEWEIIKKHPETGYRIVLSSPDVAPIAEAILHHHERWDGTGYPLGLSGNDIPLLSRIIAIADTYDVMMHGRSYQDSVTHDDIITELKRCAGSQFDPELVMKTIKAFS